jgi:hypothetical protein
VGDTSGALREEGHIRQHADDVETNLEIELVRVMREVADAADCAGDVRVQIDRAQAGLVVLIVAAGA